jgi:predicted Fe-S protein YdhL (DUF1289 family)
MDPVSGLCVGCARTADEIAIWRDAPPGYRDMVWERLPERRAMLGIKLSRLGWREEEIATFITRRLAEQAGVWVFGVPGATAEFSIGKEEPFDTGMRGSTIVAATARGAVRFEITRSTRVLALGEAGGSGAVRAFVLAVPRERLDLPRHAALAPLGLDQEAMRSGDRWQHLFDLGLDQPSAQFCIRTGDPALLRTLETASGSLWPALLAEHGKQILDASPHRVIRTAIGRAEVFVPIPKPGDRSPPGPHTHLLPQYLAERREMPPGAELPAAYAPAAMFYPAARDLPADCR